jgi:hypothetical protein
MTSSSVEPLIEVVLPVLQDEADDTDDATFAWLFGHMTFRLLAINKGQIRSREKNDGFTVARRLMTASCSALLPSNYNAMQYVNLTLKNDDKWGSS